MDDTFKMFKDLKYVYLIDIQKLELKPVKRKVRINSFQQLASSDWVINFGYCSYILNRDAFPSLAKANEGRKKRYLKRLEYLNKDIAKLQNTRNEVLHELNQL